MSELAVLEKMIALDPNNLDLQSRLADAHSWLGEFAERQGDLAEAMKQYETQAMLDERLAESDPGTVGRRFDQGNALMFEVNTDMATGRFSAAGSPIGRARVLYDDLVAHDASNLRWRLAALNLRLVEAMLARRSGDLEGATRLVDDALPQLESLSASEPSDRSVSLRVAFAWRLRAQLQSQSSAQAAAEAAMHAVSIGEMLVRDGRAADVDVAECATAYVVSGDISSSQADSDEARRDWLRAAELLAPRTARGCDWRLLDPAARAAARLGRSDEARAIIRRLSLIGYVPLDPWPTPDPAPAAPNSDQQPR
jgi:tetratricopeptide (TPR) repeat protein